MDPRAIVLFRELADRSPAERDEYFVRHDVPPALRAEIESLLQFDGVSSDSFRDGVAAAVRAALLQHEPVFVIDNHTATAGETASPGDLERDINAGEGRFPAGTILAERYRVISLLGRGGMGEVYRVTDLKLSQAVALKLLPARLSADGPFLARMHSEVRLARQVSHPNVCRVYDIGEFAGGAYISMEYIDGEDLGSLIQRIGRLPHEKVVDLARGLCAGLAAAHDRQVVHRDLKPANIMINRRGQVVITDFGLASTARDLKGADIRSGTPAYMAPEQLSGREVSLRSDIYSLGLVIYEMVCGRRAFATNMQLSRGLPHLLPGGRALLFNLLKAREPQGSVAVRVLDSGEERILIADASHPSYVDGWLIFARSGTLFAMRFDVERLAVEGTPVPVLQGLLFAEAFGTAQYSVSATGRLAYVPGAAAAGRELTAVDRQGTASTISELRRAYFIPRVAPDGARVALTILEDGAYSVWLAEIPNGRPALVAENAFAPVWSPDGRRVAFTNDVEGRLNLAVIAVDDGTAARSIYVDNALKVPTSWTPDGQSIVFTRVDPSGTTGEDIYIVGADGTRARPLLQSTENETGGVVSPDGNWLASSIGSLITGGIAVAPMNAPQRQTRVDAEAATMPVWSHDGRELFFLAGAQKDRMMAATVLQARDDLRLNKPRLLFERTMGPSIGLNLPRYDVMPDDRRFVFTTPQDPAPITEIRLTLDWMQQLRALLTDGQ